MKRYRVSLMMIAFSRTNERDQGPQAPRIFYARMNLIVSGLEQREIVDLGRGLVHHYSGTFRNSGIRHI